MIRQVLAAVLLAFPTAAQDPAQSFDLSSGLHCLLVESHERPLIRMEMVTRWDPAELPAGKEGLGGFLALVMAAGGAGPYNRAGFNRALDGLGMGYAFEAETGTFRWTLTADSRSQETAMELLTDAVARPALDGPQAELQRQALIKQTNAASLRELTVARFLWTLGDPATMLPPAAAALERIEFQDLLDFQRRVVRPEHSTLALYGDLNLAQAKQLVLMHLGIWGPSAQAPVAGVVVKASARRAPEPRLTAALDPSPAAELWLGAPAPPQGSSPAAEALLPILLARAARTVFSDLEMTFTLVPGRTLLVKAKLPQADRDRLVASFTRGLDSLRRDGFSSGDLGFALIQWRAENTALPLHPGALLRRRIEGRLDPGLARAVAGLTVGQVAEALKAWLDPARTRFLLLGGDAPVLQAAEKAGLGPSAIAPGQ
jgi:hypothetical protein